MYEQLKEGSTAIIYGRYSSKPQAQGHSEDRQIQRAEAYAVQHKLSIDHSLSCFDKGLSGFHGHNKDKGTLGILLAQVKEGRVPVGSVLLVEDTDRLSRQEPMEALSTLQDLINAGLYLVTVADGQIYSRDRLKRDIGSLYVLIGKLHRAYDESLIKSDRAKAGWRKKREEAAKGNFVAKRQPFWLTTDGQLIPEKAAIVNRIFNLYVNEGVGASGIARSFNQEKVETASKRGSWHPQNISYLLKDKMTIGYWLEHRIYPPVIDEALFWKTQDLLKLRSRRAGSSSFVSVSRGVSSCAVCGGSLKVVKNIGSVRSIFCRAVLNGACTNKGGFPYRSFILATALAVYYEIASESAREADSSLDVSAMTSKLNDVKEQVRRLISLAQLTGDIEEISENLKKLKEEERELEDQISSQVSQGSDDIFDNVMEWIDEKLPLMVSKAIEEDVAASSEFHRLLCKLKVKVTMRSRELTIGDLKALPDTKGRVLISGREEGMIVKGDDGTQELGGGYWWRLGSKYDKAANGEKVVPRVVRRYEIEEERKRQRTEK